MGGHEERRREGEGEEGRGVWWHREIDREKGGQAKLKSLTSKLLMYTFSSPSFSSP